MSSHLNLELQELANTISGAELLNHALPIQKTFSEFIYDSRQEKADSIFFAIAGTQVDGHDFITQAIANGSTLIIGDNKQKLQSLALQFKDKQFLFVPNTLHYLQSIATYYRKKFQIPVVGITGSSGKTTTKDLLASILNKSGQALAPKASLNNHWGVPQTVLQLRTEHKAAVFELGTSGPGEITQLCNICQPNIGYITLIGSSHLQVLKDENGVLRAKRELFDWILLNSIGTDKNSTLLFNIDNVHLKKLYEEFKLKKFKILTLSSQSSKADFFIESKKALGAESRFGWEFVFQSPFGKIEGQCPLAGEHNLSNALAASSLALLTGTARIDSIVDGLLHPEISKLRSDLFQIKNGAFIYDDSYNANPTSVAACFETSKLIRDQSQLRKTIAVVGDMLELGENSDSFHKEMGEKAASLGIDVLLATGKNAELWVKGFCSKQKNTFGKAYQTQEELFDGLTKELETSPNQTLVLIKGSRGSKMDKITSLLKSM